jgi:hypothetical protein
MRTGSRRGRKIVGTVLQLLSLLNDHGMTLGQAFLQARIDASGGRLFSVDNSVPAATLAALRSIHPTTTGHRAPFPFSYGCPSDVVHTTKRTNEGCPEVPNCPAAQLPSYPSTILGGEPYRFIGLARQNWLFGSSLRAGTRATAVISLLQSAKLSRHAP